MIEFMLGTFSLVSSTLTCHMFLVIDKVLNSVYMETFNSRKLSPEFSFTLLDGFTLM
jgi:hypothetical protein